jgi:hypothetical protein
MGIFNFSKKSASPLIQDMIWMSQTAKLNGCMRLLQQLQDFVVVGWFPDTIDEFNKFLNEKNGLGVEIVQARSVLTVQAANKKLILLEHYPLHNKEIDFISNLNPPQVIVLSSLDEPLFEKFGSDKIIQTMKSLGMKEDEMIQHPMITKAIEQAQNKLEKKVVVESSGNSSKEWFERNILS